MSNDSQGYHLSFFKPTTQQAKLNRNLVVLLFSIWAVAIFGFQITLRLIQKPVPEKAYTVYERIRSSVESGNASTADLRDLTHVSLSVLGKVFVQPAHETALNQAVSWSVFQLAGDSIGMALGKQVADFEAIELSGISITDQAYIDARNSLMRNSQGFAGISPKDPISFILPLALTSSSMTSTPPASIRELPEIMSLYLIHNQSFLTDFKFLGFPFHYFYTSIFLLVLFVGLCWLYCVRINRMNAKLKIAD